MSLTRRQVLILSGLIGGGGIAILGRQALSRLSSLSGSPSSSSSLGAPLASPTPVAVASPAPSGWFAPPRGDVRIAVISDLNSSYGSTTYEPEVGRAIALIPQWQPDLVVCAGDMVAGQRLDLSTQDLRAMWAGFDKTIRAPLYKAGIPFGFTVGNHDASGAVASGRFVFQTERDEAAAYWRHPSHPTGLTFVDRGQFPFYYSFQQRDIFYLVWDASTDGIAAAQLDWVQQSLSSAAAKAARLRIVIGHLPLYGIAVGRNRPGEVLVEGDRLRQLLERYHVHTYISGHHHAYYPGHVGNLQLLYTGALGSGPRQLVSSSLPPRKTITIIDVDIDVEADRAGPSNTTRYTTYDMKTQSVIAMVELPRWIDGLNGRVWRRDLQAAGHG